MTCAADSGVCRGTAVLRALRTQRVDGVRVTRGTVLARSSYRIVAGKVVTVRLSPTRAGKHALAARSLTRAALVLGARTRTVTLRH